MNGAHGDPVDPLLEGDGLTPIENCVLDAGISLKRIVTLARVVMNETRHADDYGLDLETVNCLFVIAELIVELGNKMKLARQQVSPDECSF